MNREHLKAWIDRFSSKIFFGILGNVCIGILFCRPNFCPVKRAWQACSQSNLIVQSRSSSGQGSYWKIQFTKPKRQTYTEFNSQISDARNKSREQKKNVRPIWIGAIASKSHKSRKALYFSIQIRFGLLLYSWFSPSIIIIRLALWVHTVHHQNECFNTYTLLEMRSNWC